MPSYYQGQRGDVGLYHIPGERDIYLDAVLSLANPRTYPGCENKAGKVAELWARRKNAEHPVFDRQTGRRLQPFDFCALAFERHGFIAKETKSFIFTYYFFFVRKAKAQDCIAIPRHAVRRCNKKQLLAVGPEKLHTVGTKQKHGDTETNKALPRKDIFRTFSVVRQNTTKYNLEEQSPTTYTTHAHFQRKRIS